MAKANHADDEMIKLHDCQDYATMAERSLINVTQTGKLGRILKQQALSL